MEWISVLIIIFALFVFSRVLLRFRERKVSKAELLLWSVIWLAVIVVAVIPETSSEISRFFGIERGVDLLVYISIIVIFYLIFRLYIKTEQIERNITKIVRKISKEE